MNLVGLPTPEEPFMDREELARTLGVGLRTLDRWREDPGFPQERWGPRIIRFQASEVRKWLRDRHKEAA